jgi:superfamily I DNA/RNA helicase
VRALRSRLSAFAKDPGAALVGWMRQLLEAVDYRAEVERAHPDPKTRDERWLGVMEILDLAENHVRRTKQAGLPSFLETLALSADEDAARISARAATPSP